MAEIVYGGIEGGGTHSKIVLVNASGKVLARESHDITTSHWLIGMTECQKRINDMVQSAKKKAGLPSDMPLRGLGLSLSGCEQEETNLELKNGLKKTYPDLSIHYNVVSDTVGSVVTANPSGGIVLISGTGSNSLLLNPDGTTHRCGGWGYLLGDEGSAYWLAHRAIKMIIDEGDNFAAPLAHTTDKLKPIIFTHFRVKDVFGLLDHAYTSFDKAFFADLARKIADGASTQQDPLCMELFREAGVLLGRHLAALMPNVSKTLLDEAGGLHIVCVGQMWKSWEFIKSGFMQGLRGAKDKGDYVISEFTLVTLRTSPSLGAAYLGAKAAGHLLPIDSATSSVAFFHWKDDRHING